MLPRISSQIQLNTKIAIQSWKNKQHFTTDASENSVANLTRHQNCNSNVENKQHVTEEQYGINLFSGQLDYEGFWNRIRVDEENQIKTALFAHSGSLAYVQSYPNLLFIDSTYKLNKFGMMLVNLIGVDACERSFCIAFALMNGETEEDYVWVLNQLRSIYEFAQIKLPSVILTDCCQVCINAVSHCFPSSTSLLYLSAANKAVLRLCKPKNCQQQQKII